MKLVESNYVVEHFYFNLVFSSTQLDMHILVRKNVVSHTEEEEKKNPVE